MRIRHIRAASLAGGRRMSPGAKAQDESGDVRKIFENTYELVRRHRWLILFVFLATFGASILYVMRKAPEFEAASVIVIEEENYDPSNALTFGSISGLDNSTTSMHLLVLAKSSVLAERVADRLAELGTVPGSSEKFSLLRETGSDVDLARRIQSAISLKSPALNVIDVNAVGPTGHEAAALANLFAEEAVEQSRVNSRRRIAASRQFLEQRIEEGREALATAEDNLQQYLRREGAVALDQEVSAAVSNLARIEVAQSEAQIELQMRQASLQSTETELATIKPKLTERVASGVDREIATAQQRLADLELRLEQIFHQYPDFRENPGKDPRIVPLQQEVAYWKDKINTLSERYVKEVLSAGGVDPDNPESGVAYAAGLERQLVSDRIAASGLESKIEALQWQRNQLDGRLRQAPKQTVEIAQLQRARSSAEQLYTYLERRLQEAQLAEEAETGSLRLLRSAWVPVRPVSPRPERIFPLSLLLGLLASLGAAVLSTKLDRRFYTPTDVTEDGFHLLGVIPDMRSLVEQEFCGASEVEMSGRKVASNMVALVAPHTAAAEAYRHLFARLRPNPDASGAHAIMVTSPEASVGKSTTALNLAVTAASARLRTLIVDVDMRRPAVECYLGIPCGITLQDVFDQPEDIDILPYLTERSATGVYNLHAITVREPIQNPLEHLLSPRLRKLTDLLQHHFDFIIFDAPPLLLTPDAALLAPLCDTTIVVIAAGETDRAALQQIKVELSECNAELAGIVLNRFDSSNRIFRTTYGYLQNNYSGYYRRTAG